MPRVLVLEDEALIAEMLTDWLVELGFEVVGPASTVRDALSLIAQSDVEAAILDARLPDGDNREVAELLRSKSVPFAFASGRVSNELEAVLPALLRSQNPSTFISCEACWKPCSGDNPATASH